jgi:perosamine synthetase
MNKASSDGIIPLFKVFMPESALPMLQQTLYSGYIGEGPCNAQFERSLAAWLGVRSVLTVNSGTSSLHLALRLAGVGPGDEVVSTPQTCVATNMPIVSLGATPVWADIDPWTGNVSAEDVARKCGKRCKAILAVHWGGYPCDLNELSAIARERGIPLIEDAAHAMGSEYQGKRIGQHADFVCFSFQAIKMLTTGDGGALICRSPKDETRARRLRWFGLDRHHHTDLSSRWEQDIEEDGYKFHMNDIAATLGCAQLPHLADNLAKHRLNAARYNDALQDLRSIRPLRYAADRRSAYWLYTVRVAKRDAFIAHMRCNGIMTSRVHVRNDRYSVFSTAASRGLDGVGIFDAEQVNIPCGWWLQPDDVAAVIRAMRSFEEQM